MSLQDKPRDNIGAIGSRAEFHAAVRSALVDAADAGAHEIAMLDPGFADWPLGDREVIGTLTRWVDSRRELTLMAASFDELARRHSRFVEWRRQWSHVVRCRLDPELEPEQIPTLLLIPGLVTVRLVDRVHYRGTVSTRPIDEAEGRDKVDALLQRSTEAFPVSTLGL